LKKAIGLFPLEKIMTLDPDGPWGRRVKLTIDNALNFPRTAVVFVFVHDSLKHQAMGGLSCETSVRVNISNIIVNHANSGKGGK
jgi:hypothetical protein